MKPFFKLTALSIGLSCAALGVQAQTVTLKVHHFLGPQSIQHTTMLGEWCKTWRVTPKITSSAIFSLPCSWGVRLRSCMNKPVTA